MWSLEALLFASTVKSSKAAASIRPLEIEKTDKKGNYLFLRPPLLCLDTTQLLRPSRILFFFKNSFLFCLEM